MGDMAEVWKDFKAHKKERKQRLGMPCPDCKIRLPKAEPKNLLPSQRCWCGYRDKRERGTE